MKFAVTVTLKKDVLDPQGKVVSQTLKNMGMNNLNQVRQGKFFEIDLKGKEATYEDFIIISLVIILTWFTGPDLKYSKERITIDIIIRVNKENFCLFPLFKKTERADIMKSSLPISLDILINTQIRLMKKFPLGLMLCQFQLQHKIKDHQQHLRVNLFL